MTRPAVALALAAAFVLAASAQAATRLAVAPVREAPDTAAIEHALAETLAQLPSVALANAREGRFLGPRGAVASGPAGAAFAREQGAQRVLVVEPAKLGEGRILYLQLLDAAGRALGSTTASLSGAAEVAPADRPALKGALVRLLEPARFVGRLQLKVDVPDAEVQIDGRKPAHPGSDQPIELSVGTHALRVTHPAYRDFLRFVDVEFDQTVPIDVALSAYPLAEGEMTEKLRRQTGPKKVLPWWRSWWALTLAGVAITGTVTGIVWGAREGLSADQRVTYRPSQTP